MQPEQIQKAVDELWILTQNPKKPASEIINEYTRSRRYIGSKDRKAITQGVWLKWRQKDFPNWIKEKIPNFENEWKEMQFSQAPIGIRVNGDRNGLKAALEQEGIQSSLMEKSLLGLVIEKRTNLESLTLFKDGLFEVQDEGSQLIGLAVGVQPNDRVLELCAGAGGKSLLFAQMMQNKGKIVASDISARSLAELEKRAKRAKVSIITTTLQIPNEKFDIVVIDAPCSGTGTYRRTPDNVHKLTKQQFDKILSTQEMLLDKALDYVKDDGRICYMTCSLTVDENDGQIKKFLNKHPEWHKVSEKYFSPALTQTDGFYIAVLSQRIIG